MTSGGGLMSSEMLEQPRALERLLEYRRAAAAEELGGLRPRAGVLLIARGSSDHAATYGRYVLEAALRVPVSLCAPSLWTRHGSDPGLDGHLAIGLSQSGRTQEIVEVLARAGAAGAATLAITNDAASPLAKAGQVSLTLGVGPERAVPATKTFLAQLLALAIVAEALGEAPWSERDPELIPAGIQELLDDGDAVALVAAELAQARAVVQVAGGFLYAVAQEAALKIIETASLPVTAYSASDLLHGPVAMTGADVPVVCYSHPGPLAPDLRRVAALAAGRGAPVVWVGEGAPSEAAHALRVSAIVPEALAPLLHVVRAQQLALSISRAVGRDADLPRGLEKVTVTT